MAPAAFFARAWARAFRFGQCIADWIGHEIEVDRDGGGVRVLAADETGRWNRALLKRLFFQVRIFADLIFAALVAPALLAGLAP